MNHQARNSVPDVASACLAAAMGALFALVPWLMNPRYYFIDDAQHDSYPLFYHIGQILRDGQFPIVTLGNFVTSNLLAEYQTALFNPVMLLVSYVISGIDNYHLASLLFVSFHFAIFGSGLFVLARSYGVSRSLALIFAAALLTNNFISYWYAESWLALFYTTCWMVWAWAALARARQSRLWAAASVVLVYITIVSGFPNTTLFLGVVALVVALQRWRETGRLGTSVLVIGLMGAGTLLSAIPLLSVLSTSAVAERVQQTFNNGFLVPNLKDVLSLSSPFHRGQIFIYGGFRTIGTPIFYCAWLLVPLLPFIAWNRSLLRLPALLSLLGLAALLLLATQGPEQVHALRYPFRWISFLHITLMLGFVLLIHVAGTAPLSRRRIGLSAALLVLQFVVSWQTLPQEWAQHAGAIAISLAGVVLFVALARNHAARAGVAIGVTLVFFVLTHAAISTNPDIADWGVSEVAGDMRGAEIPPSYAAYIGGFGNVGDPRRLEEYGTGLMQLAKGIAMLNGYTPIGHKALSALMCMDQFGQTCPEAGPRLLGRDPETGAALADLFHLERIIALKGPHLAQTEAALTSEWRLDKEGIHTRQYVRALTNTALPGTVSFLSPGLSAAEAASPSAQKEELDVSAGAEGGSLIFARLWWPGYQARLGDADLPVTAHLGIFVKVQVPPDAEGRLTLQFLPPNLWLGLGSMLTGALLAMLLVLYHRRLTASQRGPGPEAASGVMPLPAKPEAA